MTDTAEFPYKGQCLCGSIKYEVAKIEPRMGHCHCSMCRKFHGAAFATLGEAYAENCGSSLIFEAANDDGKLVEFSLGTLDTDIELKPDAHIFTESGANWCEVGDDLPQFKAGRDS